MLATCTNEARKTSRVRGSHCQEQRQRGASEREVQIPPSEAQKGPSEGLGGSPPAQVRAQHRSHPGVTAKSCRSLRPPQDPWPHRSKCQPQLSKLWHYHNPSLALPSAAGLETSPRTEVGTAKGSGAAPALPRRGKCCSIPTGQSPPRPDSCFLGHGGDRDTERDKVSTAGPGSEGIL